jgi:phospholipase/carboxylesterase
MGLAGVGASLLSGCQSLKGADQPVDLPLNDPVLIARVYAPKGTVLQGTTVPYNAGSQQALLYVPASYHASTPAPFLLMLHGEGAVASAALSVFQPYADTLGLVIMAVDSSSTTWDTLYEGFYGPDVSFINGSLTAAFSEVNVDPARVSIGGFSDGASYALTVGLTNGDLFSRAILFSPGVLPPYTPKGKPKFFMSQGASDPLFDAVDSGRFLSQKLIAAGYDVDYQEFSGGHELPDAIVQLAVAWMTT